MKENYTRIGLAKLCGWFGITRQAYYQNGWRSIDTTIEEELVLKEVLSIRKNHPRMGTRKLYEKIQPFLVEHSIKMGRDLMFDLLASHNLLVKKRKRRIFTTQSYHWLRKYTNLIRDFAPTAPNQLWVSDITYWKIRGTHFYISFITDAYSHKIVGYHVAETLEAIESIHALKMAIASLRNESILPFQLIHHSDRGLQYCSYDYVKILQDNKIRISMTESGDPLDNAIAERVNGIIKDEYLNQKVTHDIRHALLNLNSVVKLYNEDRPHMSIGNLYPSVVHETKVKKDKLWKNYYPKKQGKEVLQT